MKKHLLLLALAIWLVTVGAFSVSADWNVLNQLVDPPDSEFITIPASDIEVYFEDSYTTNPTNKIAFSSWQDVSGTGYFYFRIHGLKANDYYMANYAFRLRTAAAPSTDYNGNDIFTYSVVSPDTVYDPSSYWWMTKSNTSVDWTTGRGYVNLSRTRIPPDFQDGDSLLVCCGVSLPADSSGVSVSFDAITLSNVYRVYEDIAVVYDSQGGSLVEPQYYLSGDVPFRPAAPTRAGYSFVGWYTDKSGITPYYFTQPVIKDITLYAKWQQIVSVDTGDGLSFDIDYNPDTGLLSPPSELPTKDGFYFAGVYKDAEMTQLWDYSIDQYIPGETQLYVKWSPDAYTGVYDAASAPGSSDISVVGSSWVNIEYSSSVNPAGGYVSYSFPGAPSGTYLVNLPYQNFGLRECYVYPSTAYTDISPVLYGYSASIDSIDFVISSVVHFNSDSPLLTFNFSGIASNADMIRFQAPVLIPIDAAPVDEPSKYGVFAPLIVWLRNFFNDWNPGGGDYETVAEGIAAAEVDSSAAELESTVESISTFEESLLDDIDSGMSEISIDTFETPAGIFSSVLWVSDTFMQCFNGLGDFKYIVMLPMYVGLALLLIGRGEQAANVHEMRHRRRRASKAPKKGGGG